jgi:hypothetical protein
MGQFYYFAHSDFAKQFVADPDALAPTIARYKRFRDKHSAHRAIDAPRNDDTQHARSNYAWALSSLGGMGFAPKPAQPSRSGPQPFNPRVIWLQNYFQLQLFDGTPGSALNFSLEREHPAISVEAYRLLEAILVAP